MNFIGFYILFIDMKTKASNLSESQAQREYRKLCEVELKNIAKHNKEEFEKAKEEFLLK